MSRQPGRRLLKQTVTLWNRVGEDIKGGSRVRKLQKTYIRHVRAEFCKRTNMLATGDRNADSLLLLIFNGASQAEDEQGHSRMFVTPDVFLLASELERIGMWTLNTGDHIGLGVLDGDASPGGELARKDWRINIIDPIYGNDGQLHHWEATGA